MKKQMATLLLAAALTLWALPASAQTAREGVQLETTGGNTSVALTLPQSTAAQGITSLQMSFSVQGGDVKFDFADNLPATVQESRYKNGTMTIYLSGRDKLLDENGSIQLGEISVTNARESAVTVTFDADSLVLLNAAHGDVQTDELPETSVVMTPGTTDDGDQSGSDGGSGSQGGTGGSQNSGTGSTPSATQKPDSQVEPTSTPVPNAETTLISPVGGTGYQSTATRNPTAATQTDSEVQVPGSLPTPSAEPTATPQATPLPDSGAATATAESAAPQSDPGGLPILPIAAGVAVLAVVVFLVIRRFFF